MTTVCRRRARARPMLPLIHDPRTRDMSTRTPTKQFRCRLDVQQMVTVLRRELRSVECQVRDSEYEPLTECPMRMHNPPHPGEIIKTLCLGPLGVTVTQAAGALGVSRKTLSAILNGRAGISPEMAVRLSIASARPPRAGSTSRRTTTSGTPSGVGSGSRSRSLRQRRRRPTTRYTRPGLALLAPAGERELYAAGTGERADMIRDNSRREAPRISSDLMSRSSDTDGSPASILAIRDWLDWSRFARSACVSLRRWRHSRKPIASRTLSSMYAASSVLRRRNSWAVPTFQPLASRRRFFSSRTVVLRQSADARVNDRLRRRPGLVAEDRQNHDGVGVSPVHDPPVDFGVTNSQFVTSRPHNGHRPRVGHRQRLALLQQPEQVSRLDPGRLRKGRRLDLSVKPHERPIARAHDEDDMSDPTSCQDPPVKARSALL